MEEFDYRITNFYPRRNAHGCNFVLEMDVDFARKARQLSLSERIMENLDKDAQGIIRAFWENCNLGGNNLRPIYQLKGGLLCTIQVPGNGTGMAIKDVVRIDETLNSNENKFISYIGCNIDYSHEFAAIIGIFCLWHDLVTVILNPEKYELPHSYSS